MQTSFSVQSGAGPSEGKTLFSQKALQLFTLTLTAQNETDDGIAEVLERVRFDRETNLC